MQPSKIKHTRFSENTGDMRTKQNIQGIESLPPLDYLKMIKLLEQIENNIDLLLRKDGKRRH